MLAVRLPEELEKRLVHLCKSTNRPKSFYMRQALEQFLDEEEEKQIALSAYEDYLNSGKKTVSVNEVLIKAGLPPLHED
jgi:RHH-type rel operon transcriptional repressor/antitoxin RelB